MKRKRILITVDWFLPGTLSGGPVRSYANLIEHLKDDFDFYIITRNTDYGSTTPYEGIVSDRWTSFNESTKIYYINTSHLNKKRLKTAIKSINFDVAFVNGIYSWYFSILPIFILKKLQKPIIVSARGMLNPQAFSIKGTKKKIYLKIAKLLRVYNGVQFHATNIDEAACIKKEIGGCAKVIIASNLPRKIVYKQHIKSKLVKPIKFVNIARIAVEKGTLKMLKALSGIEQPLLLDLYGPVYDKDYWNKCKDVITKLPSHINVNYKGVIDSDKIPATLMNYDYFVLLSEGENFGHAILEALSVGLPVIISNRTPWKDLEAKCLGWDLDVDDQSHIIEAYKKAIKMPDNEYKLWSYKAYGYAKKFIENPKLIEQNKALFLNALKE